MALCTLLAALLVAQSSPAPSPPPLVDAPVAVEETAETAPAPRPRVIEREEPEPEPEGFIGLDASQWARRFGHPPPVIDTALLEWAPTSPQSAMWASLGTTLTGTGLLLGSFFLTQRSAVGVGTLGGIVLMNFGPAMGDLLNGDWKRFLWTGLGRLALLVVGPFVPYAIFGWFFWIVWDVRQARHAPARWVERHRDLFAAPPSAGPPPPPRGF